MSRREPVMFSETQSLRQWHARVVLALPPAAMVFITCRQVIWHKPWTRVPTSDGGLIFLSLLLIFVYLRLATVKLVTELRNRELAVGLRGLWKRRRIPLDEIRSAEVVTYDAVADFGGYGIRSGSRGSAYIARGNRAVELVVSDAKKVLIGSQIPADLARKIQEHRKKVQS